MADYVFVTRWRFEAPIETVWTSHLPGRGVAQVVTGRPAGGDPGARRPRGDRRPASIRWNHDVILRWGGEGLAFRLGCAWRDAGGGAD